MISATPRQLSSAMRLVEDVLNDIAETAAIAKGLSAAQRAAIFQLGDFIGCRWPCHFEGRYKGASASTLNALADKGLIWGRENGSNRYAGVLPLGLSVRRYLQDQQP